MYVLILLRVLVLRNPSLFFVSLIYLCCIAYVFFHIGLMVLLYIEEDERVQRNRLTIVPHPYIALKLTEKGNDICSNWFAGCLE